MISQETFDSMVQENMDDFDLAKPEALSETVKQLTSMGKDISNIDISGGEGLDEILQCINKIKQFSNNDINIIQSLTELNAKSNDKAPLGIRNQNVIRNKGCISAIIDMISLENSYEILQKVFELLETICKTNGKL
jgi:ABC-type histidine transport system ATPase subunit